MFVLSKKSECIKRGREGRNTEEVGQRGALSGSGEEQREFGKVERSVKSLSENGERRQGRRCLIGRLKLKGS